MCPYLETDNLESAITCAKGIARSDCTAYVVDRTPLTMYEEIFVAISSSFRRIYSMRFE
jgi:hypothetical protein